MRGLNVSSTAVTAALPFSMSPIAVSCAPDYEQLAESFSLEISMPAPTSVYLSAHMPSGIVTSKIERAGIAPGPVEVNCEAL